MDAIVILPDKFRCLWTSPPDDADYKTRWALIKTGLSRAIPKGKRLSASRIERGGQGISKSRYWKHVIVDEHDLKSHVDSIQWNPVKQGMVEKVWEWPYSNETDAVRSSPHPTD
ncbi:MAG: REP-associated tyrosine transposase [Gammaproteobacteria bacterium]